METIILPVNPNVAISRNQKTLEGEFTLKKFGDTGFAQNVSFDESLIIYDDNYQNNQSNSEIFVNHMHSVYSIIKSRCSKGSKLFEVGCGKGAFLDIVKADGYFKYAGVDAAYEGSDENIESRYLNENDRIDADIVVLRHTLEHIKSPHTFIELLRKVFGADALIYVEVPLFDWIEVNKVLFDFTYEHVNYFSQRSLCSLFTDVIAFGECFGGQYQYCLARLGEENSHSHRWRGFDLQQNWIDFNIEDYLLSFEKDTEFLHDKQRLWVWGGATKGVLFLKHLSDLSPSVFDKVVAVVDINPKKQSMFTPSTNLPIIAPQEMFAKVRDGDFVLVMNPNYVTEIRRDISRNTSAAIEIGFI